MTRGMKREKMSAGTSANSPEYCCNSGKLSAPRPFSLNREGVQVIVA
jgi:hypothetical protein